MCVAMQRSTADLDLRRRSCMFRHVLLDYGTFPGRSTVALGPLGQRKGLATLFVAGAGARVSRVRFCEQSQYLVTPGSVFVAVSRSCSSSTGCSGSGTRRKGKEREDKEWRGKQR